jgi:pimeloyl-ACP methyl ester carboxylesterase
MIPLDRHDLVRPDATIRYWTCGRVDAPTVVLLHGATLDHHSWTPQLDELQRRYRVVIPDLRAHGESTGPFDFEATVEDVLALLDQLPARRTALVGLSLGANVAQEIVRREPDRAHALVAADTTCNTAERHPFMATATIAALTALAILPGDTFAREAARRTARTPAAQAYAVEANRHRPNRETVSILASLLTSALRPEPDYRLPVPALLLHGEFDGIGDIASDTAAWARREPLAEHAVVPAAGHASNLDNPGAFTGLLMAFLDRVMPAPVVLDPARRDEERAGSLGPGLT